MGKYVPPEIGPRYEEGGVLLLARDPGDEEVDAGRPLVGKSGRLLFGGYDLYQQDYREGIFTDTGLSREDIVIANRVPWHPWNNDFSNHEPWEPRKGWEELMELIEETRPSLIIACGNEAAYDLVPGWRNLTDTDTNKNSGGSSIWSAKGITGRRGFLWEPSHLDLPGDPLIYTTLHPASCLWQPVPMQMLLEIDMRRIGAYLKGDLERETLPTPKEIRWPRDAKPLWETSEPVAFDIETKWGGTDFLCIAFYTAGGDSLVAFDRGFEAVKPWLRSDRPKLAHNFQFDKYFLQEKMGVPVGGRVEDSQCGHWACYPELAGKKETGREDTRSGNQMTRKGLLFLGSFHLNVPFWKTAYGTGTRWEMGQLCADDVYVTQRCWSIIQEEMTSMGVWDQYERARKKSEIGIKAQARGMLIDEPLRRKRIRKLEVRKDELVRELKAQTEEFLKTHGLTHKEDGDEYWWYHDARCECCFGGSKASRHCTECAGISGSGSDGAILKSDLVGWATSEGHEVEGLNKDEVFELLPPCEECGGVGTVPSWDFNPLSDLQLQVLLFDILEVPAKCHGYSSPNAQEDTIKRVQEWAEGELPRGILNLEDLDE